MGWALLNSPLMWAAGLISVPILIHLFNRRQFKIVRWGAMDFLLQASKENKRKVKIQHLLVLLLRCLAIVLLALLLARPAVSSAGLGFLPGVEDQVERVVILDDSADVDRVFANVGKLIAAFERTLLSGETRFDQYARGLENGDAQDLVALNEDELAGARLFFGEARCHMCHHGPTLSDLEFHDVRLPSELPAAERATGRLDGLRAVVTDPFNGLGEFSDDRGEHARNQLAYLVRNPHTLGEFKTPGLRDVASTAPYMHTGQFNTLEDVVAHYATLSDVPRKRHEDADDVLVATHLDAQQQRQLVAFLRSLTPLEPTSTPPNQGGMIR